MGRVSTVGSLAGLHPPPIRGLALFLFQAQNETDVKVFGRLAEMPFDRVVEAIRVEPLVEQG